MSKSSTPHKSNMAALMGCVESVWRDPSKRVQEGISYLSHHVFDEMSHKVAVVAPSMIRNPVARDPEMVRRVNAEKADLLQDIRSGNPHNRMIWEELAQMNKMLGLPSTHTNF
ncbi:MAG: hypothetical protein WDO70_05635 [Alphaproteobacteria bacterium]